MREKEGLLQNEMERSQQLRANVQQLEAENQEAVAKHQEQVRDGDSSPILYANGNYRNANSSLLIVAWRMPEKKLTNTSTAFGNLKNT